MKIFLREEVDGKKLGFFRSNLELTYGQIFKSSQSIRRQMWSDNKKKLEYFFEYKRKNKYPNKPSRLTSTFCSPYKNNRFNYQGKFTYLVELLGNTHYGDSRIIDTVIDPIISNSFADVKPMEIYEIVEDYIDMYWQGKLGERKDIEILSDQVRIINIFKDKLNAYDQIRTIDELNARIIAGYSNAFIKKYKITVTGDNRLIHDIVLPRGTIFDIAFVPKKYKGKFYKITGYLKGDKDKNEITIEDENLMQKIKII